MFARAGATAPTGRVPAPGRRRNGPSSPWRWVGRRQWGPICRRPLPVHSCSAEQAHPLARPRYRHKTSKSNCTPTCSVRRPVRRGAQVSAQVRRRAAAAVSTTRPTNFEDLGAPARMRAAGNPLSPRPQAETHQSFECLSAHIYALTRVARLCGHAAAGEPSRISSAQGQGVGFGLAAAPIQFARRARCCVMGAAVRGQPT